MKILVTGSSGQVGSSLLACAPEGHQVVGLARADLDLADRGAIHSVIASERPDWVINAAAYTAVDKAESEPELAHAINDHAVRAIVDALGESGGKLAHISTDFVFDGSSNTACSPGGERSPLSVYGESKAAGEAHLREQDILVRTSWVYAAGGANFVRTMLRLMRERDNLGVVTDQIGAPTWANGLARTIWGLVELDPGGIWHHSDAGVASWYDFAVAIGEEALAGGLIERIPTIRPITTTDYPTPAKRPAFSLLDCRATRAALGDEPVHWRTNLRQMLKEERELELGLG